MPDDAEIAKEALVKIVSFSSDPKNRDLTYSQAVYEMTTIASRALQRLARKEPTS